MAALVGELGDGKIITLPTVTPCCFCGLVCPSPAAATPSNGFLVNTVSISHLQKLRRWISKNLLTVRAFGQGVDLPFWRQGRLQLMPVGKDMFQKFFRLEYPSLFLSFARNGSGDNRGTCVGFDRLVRVALLWPWIFPPDVTNMPSSQLRPWCKTWTSCSWRGIKLGHGLKAICSMTMALSSV